MRHLPDGVTNRKLPHASSGAGGRHRFMRHLPFLLLTLTTAAFAQAPAQDAAPAAAPQFSPPAAVEPASQVPNPEKIRRSAEALTRMRDILKDVLGKLEEARNTRDVVKLNCVNEKLTQIKGLLRISEQADVAMQEAIAKGETQGAEHEYTKVTIARQKVEQMRTEAEECIGQLAFRTDENLLVEVEEPVGLPEDPTVAPTMPPATSRPPPASPTL